MEFKAIMFKKSMLILYNKSNKDNMLKLKKDKNHVNIKPKEVTILMIILIFISIVLVLVHIKLKCNGLKNKKLNVINQTK